MKQFTRITPTETLEVGGRYKRAVVVKRFRDEDGQVHEFTTFCAEGSHAGGVIAVTPDGRVPVLYQFRAGPERYFYEMPGGKFNPGEDFQAAAMRELREETGYTSDTVVPLGTSCRDAYTNTQWHYYLATNCYQTDTGQALDAEERAQGVECRLLSIAEFLDHALNDRMTDPAAVLMAYEQLKEIQRETT